MLFLIFIALFFHFRSLVGQPLPLDANGISLDEKVLVIERMLLTPGTILFPVDPCNEILSGPPRGGPDGVDQIGDQTSARKFPMRTLFPTLSIQTPAFFSKTHPNFGT
jgi:hypothetical protein